MPFRRLEPNHENQLTRALLVVLRFSPVAHAAWLRLVAPDRQLQHLPAASFATQTAPSATPATEDEPAELVSVFLTPEAPLTGGGVVTESDRAQVLDAVIDYGGELLVVVENKVAEDDDRQARELNINRRAVRLADGQEAVVVLWRDVLEAFIALRERHLVAGAEAAGSTTSSPTSRTTSPSSARSGRSRSRTATDSGSARRLRQLLGEAVGLDAADRRLRPLLKTPAGDVIGAKPTCDRPTTGAGRACAVSADTLEPGAQLLRERRAQSPARARSLSSPAGMSPELPLRPHAARVLLDDDRARRRRVRGALDHEILGRRRRRARSGTTTGPGSIDERIAAPSRTGPSSTATSPTPSVRPRHRGRAVAVAALVACRSRGARRPRRAARAGARGIRRRVGSARKPATRSRERRGQCRRVGRVTRNLPAALLRCLEGALSAEPRRFPRRLTRALSGPSPRTRPPPVSGEQDRSPDEAVDLARAKAFLAQIEPKVYLRRESARAPARIHRPHLGKRPATAGVRLARAGGSTRPATRRASGAAPGGTSASSTAVPTGPVNLGTARTRGDPPGCSTGAASTTANRARRSINENDPVRCPEAG